MTHIPKYIICKDESDKQVEQNKWNIWSNEKDYGILFITESERKSMGIDYDMDGKTEYPHNSVQMSSALMADFVNDLKNSIPSNISFPLTQPRGYSILSTPTMYKLNEPIVLQDHNFHPKSATKDFKMSPQARAKARKKRKKRNNSKRK